MLRFHSPIPIRIQEFQFLKSGLLKRVSPIATPIASHGLVRFTPIRVTQCSAKQFEPIFLGSRAPILDMETLKGVQFPYIYGEDGLPDSDAMQRRPLKDMTVEVDTFITGFRIRDSVKNGDILLAARARGGRAE